MQYHKSKDIKLAAYGPQLPITKFPGGPLDSLLDQLAKKYAVSTGEILLRWVIDQGIVAGQYAQACDRPRNADEASHNQ